MYCGHCGSKVEDGYGFCANCGKPVYNAPDTSKPNNNVNNDESPRVLNPNGDYQGSYHASDKSFNNTGFNMPYYPDKNSNNETEKAAKNKKKRIVYVCIGVFILFAIYNHFNPQKTNLPDSSSSSTMEDISDNKEVSSSTQISDYQIDSAIGNTSEKFETESYSKSPSTTRSSTNVSSDTQTATTVTTKATTTTTTTTKATTTKATTTKATTTKATTTKATTSKATTTKATTTKATTKKAKHAASFHSSGDFEVAKKGNSGVYAYKQKDRGSYDNYIIIDFNNKLVYMFSEGDGSSIVDVHRIEKGNLNESLIFIFSDDGVDTRYYLYFKWQNQPDHLIYRLSRNAEVDYISTNLDNAIAIMSTKTPYYC